MYCGVRKAEWKLTLMGFADIKTMVASVVIWGTAFVLRIKRGLESLEPFVYCLIVSAFFKLDHWAMLIVWDCPSSPKYAFLLTHFFHEVVEKMLFKTLIADVKLLSARHSCRLSYPKKCFKLKKWHRVSRLDEALLSSLSTVMYPLILQVRNGLNIMDITVLLKESFVKL